MMGRGGARNTPLGIYIPASLPSHSELDVFYQQTIHSNYSLAREYNMINVCLANVPLLLVLALRIIYIEASCPSGYTEISNSCYRLISSPRLSHPNAQIDCQSDGGYLTAITSATEYSDVLNIYSGDQPFLIGLTDSSGAWAWVNGESFSFTHW